MKYFINRWKNHTRKHKLIQLKREILALYINKELIEFLSNLTETVLYESEKLFLLEFCKKVVLQNNRQPDQNHYQAFKEEYNEFFLGIAKEQLIYDPIKWLEAEINYIKTLKLLDDSEMSNSSDRVETIEPQKEWLTFAEMLKRFETSKAALRRRMAEGMPFIKFGNQLRFFPKSVDEWLVAQK